MPTLTRATWSTIHIIVMHSTVTPSAIQLQSHIWFIKEACRVLPLITMLSVNCQGLAQCHYGCTYIYVPVVIHVHVSNCKAYKYTYYVQRANAHLRNLKPQVELYVLTPALKFSASSISNTRMLVNKSHFGLPSSSYLYIVDTKWCMYVKL